MAQTRIVTLDLNFQGRPHAIASYLIRLGGAVILIESGPGSTLTALQAGLAQKGISASDVTHVLLTHIHLDHVGAAGWLAQNGAEIYVHPIGAPHMLNPEKLIASATRIYGDRMESLWGEFLPVPQSQLKIPNDAEAIQIGGAEFIPRNTPGHAEHHYIYLFEDIAFCGDVGGVRIPGYQYLRVPMPPPELHIVTLACQCPGKQASFWESESTFMPRSCCSLAGSCSHISCRGRRCGRCWREWRSPWRFSWGCCFTSTGTRSRPGGSASGRATSPCCRSEAWPAWSGCQRNRVRNSGWRWQARRSISS